MLMKFYVLRVHDDKSSDICKEMEEKSFQQGGSLFTVDQVKKGTSRDHRTGLFHPLCRCHLLPAVYGRKIVNDVDRLMVLGNGFFASDNYKALLNIFPDKEVLRQEDFVRFFTNG